MPVIMGHGRARYKQQNQLQSDFSFDSIQHMQKAKVGNWIPIFNMYTDRKVSLI